MELYSRITPSKLSPHVVGLRRHRHPCSLYATSVHYLTIYQYTSLAAVSCSSVLFFPMTEHQHIAQMFLTAHSLEAEILLDRSKWNSFTASEANSISPSWFIHRRIPFKIYGLHHGPAQQHYNRSVERGLAEGPPARLVLISMKAEYALFHILKGDISVVPKNRAVYIYKAVDYDNFPGLRPRNGGYFNHRQPDIPCEIPASLPENAYGVIPINPLSRPQTRTGPYQPTIDSSPGHSVDIADEDPQTRALRTSPPGLDPSNSSLGD